ncbi:MAG: putative lipid II flippase FtsW [Candidatus Krumholzibacteria bacterium]|nr:putative lipid II flippase FtsW [Candidatus Krumholzibacteria bacterium]
MSERRRAYDLHLLYAVLLLVALGLVMVFSASQVIARERFSSPFFFMYQHAIRVAIGLGALAVFMRVPFTLYRRLAPWILGGSLLLLGAIFVGGTGVRGATRWLRIFMFTVQPVEIAKYALVIFFAAWIADGRRPLSDLKRGFLPLAGTAVAMALLVGLQPNISNAALIIALAMTMLFLGGCRIRYLAAFAGAGLLAAAPILARVPHVWERLSIWSNRTRDAQGLGWHVKQSLIALGSGHVFGVGPGEGHQKYSFLPDAHTDFIYSIIGEELGIIGTAAVLALFALIFLRAVRIAGRAPNPFGFLLAAGIGSLLFGGAVINMAMATGLLPTAGLPLPLVSYGGSSLITSLAAVGILLNISARGREKQDGAGPLRARAGGSGLYARRVRRTRGGEGGAR